MTPPELAGDAPVADVLHPRHVILREALRHKANLAVSDALDSRLGQRRHLHKPLLGNHRLDGRVAAVARADLVRQRLDALEIAARFQILDDGLAGLHRRHACVLAAVDHARLADGRLAAGKERVVFRLLLRAGHAAVIGEHADDGQIVALANLKVVRVVRRGDLHHAGALFHVGVLVADDRDFDVHQRQDDVAAVQMRIARVVFVDGHGGIAQHRLRAGRRQFKLLARLLDGVEQVPEVPLLLLILHLRVGNGGVAARAPVDHAVAAVDQPLFVEAVEDLGDSLAASLVHGEALAAPVAAIAHAAGLADDAPAVFVLPCPRAAQEFLAADVVLVEPFLAHGLDDLHLRGDGGVIRARQPERRVALHAVIARQAVLKHAVHRVTHVKLAGDVRRRHHDGKGLLALHAVRHKRAGLLPLLVELSFDGLRVIHLVHLSGFVFHSRFLSLYAPLNGKHHQRADDGQRHAEQLHLRHVLLPVAELVAEKRQQRADRHGADSRNHTRLKIHTHVSLVTPSVTPLACQLPRRGSSRLRIKPCFQLRPFGIRTTVRRSYLPPRGTFEIVAACGGFRR